MRYRFGGNPLDLDGKEACARRDPKYTAIARPSTRNHDARHCRSVALIRRTTKLAGNAQAWQDCANEVAMSGIYASVNTGDDNVFSPGQSTCGFDVHGVQVPLGIADFIRVC
jgi:hypothetical protein